jgi:GntR family transcriptional regulator/MocR family aminotransferase
VLGSVPDGAFDYPELRGLLALRVALAGYLSRARHVVVSPGNIVVCAGITHGLSLICQVMKGRGARSVAVEAYGYKDLWDVAEGSGLHLVPVPVDDRGAMVGQCAEADGAILTPGHQFPWGVSLHPSRRRQIVEWATRCSAVVLEDDYDGEFRYDRQPVGALQALAPGHVVYVGTASKSLSPGLRIGWLVVPDGLLDEVLVARKNSGATPATLDQLVLAELITSGFYDRHVRRARLLYRGRRDRLVRALDERAPGIEVKGAAAGLQTLALLRPGQMEADVLRRGDELGVTLHGLSSYTFPGCPGPPALVIGYARPPDHAFGAAVERLCTALA